MCELKAGQEFTVTERGPRWLLFYSNPEYATCYGDKRGAEMLDFILAGMEARARNHDTKHESSFHGEPPVNGVSCRVICEGQILVLLVAEGEQHLTRYHLHSNNSFITSSGTGERFW